MNISNYLREFLLREDVRELINTNNLGDLYRKVGDVFGYRGTSELTQVLYAADVDPLRYLVYVPKDFLAYSDVVNFIIPDGVTSIGASAFEGCTKLVDITIPSSITSIGHDAFAYCSNLTSITIPNSVTSIGNSAFYGCSKLTSITIPDSVTSIGEFAFKDCSSLTSITIGSGVTRLLTRTFLGCTKLRKINYNGTADQWKKIDIDGNNARLYSCRIICTDGMLKWDRETKKWIQV